MSRISVDATIVLEYLQRNGPTSAATLAEATRLGLGRVRGAVADLSRGGVIHVVNPGRPGDGEGHETELAAIEPMR